MASNLYRAIRKGTIFKWLLNREPFYWPERSGSVVELGSRDCRWAVDASRIHPETTVLSFGLGADVTFEMALIERFGCRVLGFDPTPQSLAHVRANVTDDRFTAHPLALADYDGTMVFKKPPAELRAGISHSAYASYDTAAHEAVSVPCHTLDSIRRSHGMKRIDVLKMDIEGAELPVIDQAAREGWLADIDQLLVEFHHFLPGLHPERTRHAIETLKKAGMSIAWIGRTNHEYLFTRRR
jgi:FkbM family methyltransferase